MEEREGPLLGLELERHTQQLLRLAAVDREDSVRLERGRALAEADAAAFYSATSDFSAQTTFKKGDTPSAPALEKSKEAVAEARDALAALLRVVDGER